MVVFFSRRTGNSTRGPFPSRQKSYEGSRSCPAFLTIFLIFNSGVVVFIDGLRSTSGENAPSEGWIIDLSQFLPGLLRDLTNSCNALPISFGESSCKKCLPLTITSVWFGQVLQNSSVRPLTMAPGSPAIRSLGILL